MNTAALVYELHVGFTAALMFAGPPVAAAAAIGLLIGLLQAVTQIQDQALAQTLKIVVISLGLFAGGAVLVMPLHDQALRLFTLFPAMTR